MRRLFTALALTSGLLVGQAVIVPAAHASDTRFCVVTAVAKKTMCAVTTKGGGTVHVTSTLNAESAWETFWYEVDPKTPCLCNAADGGLGLWDGDLDSLSPGYWVFVRVEGHGDASGRVVLSVR